MSLANWYVFYSYEWYATWTAFISFDKHSVTVKVRLLKCHNRGYTRSDPCYDSLFDTSGSEMRNLWSIFHIFAPLKHPFMFLMCIYFMVFDRERLLLGHLLPSLMFIEYWEEFIIFILHADDTQFKLSSYCNFSSKCWIATFISCLSLVFKTLVDYSDNIKRSLMPSSFKVQNYQCSGIVDLLCSIL